MKEKTITGVFFGIFILFCFIPAVHGFPISFLLGLTSSPVNDLSNGAVTNVLLGEETESIMENLPNQWQQGAEEGSYYDPISMTSWVFDKMLKRFFCPQKGWFLFSQYSLDNPPKLIRQYYYDPIHAILIDIKTGEVTYIDQTVSKIQQPAQSTMIPAPSLTTEYPSSPIGTQRQGNESVDVQDEQNVDPCLISCPKCQDGSCRDCDHNNICDIDESLITDSNEANISQGNPNSTHNYTLEFGLSEDPQKTMYKIPDEASSDP